MWDDRQTKLMFNSPVGPLGRHLFTIGKKIETAAKAQVGKESLKLERSIKARVVLRRGKLALEVSATDPKALMHHEGTSPHIILPNSMKVLKFKKGGQTIFSKAVMHPGTRPNRFLSDNLVLVRT